MGYEAKKTEHCGPKRGNGAYWGYRWDAKKESNRIRRENAKREIRAAIVDAGNEADGGMRAEQTPNSRRTWNRTTRCAPVRCGLRARVQNRGRKI
jgi:hypothetical protein